MIIKTDWIPKAIVFILLSLLLFQGHLNHNEVIEIKEEVSEINITIKEVEFDLLTLPYSLQNEFHCLASNVYWEARNQSLDGRLAIAQVTMNRVESNKYPDTICGVVTQTRYYPSGNIDLHSCQFSWYCDGLKDEPIETWGFSYDESFELAVTFLEERPMDVTDGSTHYHSVKVKPYWISGLDKTLQIEEHIFYK